MTITAPTSSVVQQGYIGEFKSNVNHRAQKNMLDPSPNSAQKLHDKLSTLQAESSIQKEKPEGIVLTEMGIFLEGYSLLSYTSRPSISTDLA